MSFKSTKIRDRRSDFCVCDIGTLSSFFIQNGRNMSYVCTQLKVTQK